LKQIGDIIQTQTIYKASVAYRVGQNDVTELGHVKLLYPGDDLLIWCAENGVYGGVVYNDTWPGVIWNNAELVDVDGRTWEWCAEGDMWE
jgi:hypothetical protein